MCWINLRNFLTEDINKFTLEQINWLQNIMRNAKYLAFIKRKRAYSPLFSMFSLFCMLASFLQVDKYKEQSKVLKIEGGNFNEFDGDGLKT